MEKRPAEKYIRVCRHCPAPDWTHAPRPFKQYLCDFRVPLSTETLASLALDQDEQPAFSLGLLLHEIYGIIRVTYHKERDPVRLAGSTTISTRPVSLQLSRAVPSGGARFPCELYLLVSSGQHLPAGLYHYDPAHHVLDLLRTGDFTSALVHALAHPPEGQPGYTLLLSSLFWKDAFKYQEFSYRLQSLDIGCLLAQTQVVTEHYNLRPTLHFRFLDHQINLLLGLKQMEESVYAIVTLGADSFESKAEHSRQQMPAAIAANGFPTTLERYESLTRWPMLETVHYASSIETEKDLHLQRTADRITPPRATSDLVIELPSTACPSLRSRAVHRRSAQRMQFRPRPLSLQQLALLLRCSQRGYWGDLDGRVPRLAHTLLYCVINHVEEVPPGIYCYQAERHQLRQIRAGEFCQLFQATQFEPKVNAAHLSLCVIPVGNYPRGFQAYGDRWYRMQNMEAGMVVQRLYLATALSGLGCRANLGYSDQRLDSLLALPDDYTSLIQIFISPLASGVQESERYDLSIIW